MGIVGFFRGDWTRENIAPSGAKSDLNDLLISLTACGFFANIQSNRGTIWTGTSGLMRQPSITHRFLAIAIGLCLALPAGFSIAATPANKAKVPTSASNESAFIEIAESSNVLDSWRDYALSSLKSNFTWASDPGETLEAPSIFNRGRSSLVRTPAMRFPGSSVETGDPINVAMQSTRVSTTPLYASAETSSLLPDYSPGLRRTLVSPSVTHKISDSSFVRVSAILAYQRFSGFDLVPSDTVFPSQGSSMLGSFQPRSQESSFGAGGRVDFGSALTDWLSWQTGYQSRVNMDSFADYRGIFGQAGSFDIPPSANFGLGAAITQNLRVGVGVERVMYAQITPFASFTLPPLARLFLESSDRVLAWNNLDVYSLDVSWHNAALGDFAVRYTTRQQPLPSWQQLQQVLEPNLASHDWEAYFSHAIGDQSTLRLAAIYAPIELLGAPSFNANNAYGTNQLRFEALWSTSF